MKRILFILIVVAGRRRRRRGLVVGPAVSSSLWTARSGYPVSWRRSKILFDQHGRAARLRGRSGGRLAGGRRRCTRASGCGRWSSIAARRTGGCRRSSASGRCRSTNGSLTLGLKAAAEAEWQSAPPAVRTALTRYAEGVNGQRARATGRVAAARVPDPGLQPGPVDPDRLAGGRPSAGVAAVGKPSGRDGPGGPDGAVRHGRDPAARRVVSGECARDLGSASALLQSHERRRDGPSLRSGWTGFHLRAACYGGRVAGRIASRRSGSERIVLGRPGWSGSKPGARRGNSNNFVVAGCSNGQREAAARQRSAPADRVPGVSGTRCISWRRDSM